MRDVSLLIVAADLVDEQNARLEELIPRAFEMGVRYVELRPGFARTTVPFEDNANHFGVIYAGVTFTVAEVLGGGITAATFDMSRHFPLVKSLTIDFTAPGTGLLTATASMTDDEVARIRAAVVPGQKVAYELTAEVTGADGTLVARTRGDYQIRPFPG